jgi:hypothetical protein
MLIEYRKGDRDELGEGLKGFHSVINRMKAHASLFKVGIYNFATLTLLT